ncbi:hypothetical protein LNP74_17375 [Klebsiella pneumoniae subsp. pneumoniae]|nr:hypothetical protein [Klebsiella pneumoniae subsp. pneumoniae]
MAALPAACTPLGSDVQRQGQLKLQRDYRGAAGALRRAYLVAPDIWPNWRLQRAVMAEVTTPAGWRRPDRG